MSGVNRENAIQELSEVYKRLGQILDVLKETDHPGAALDRPEILDLIKEELAGHEGTMVDYEIIRSLAITKKKVTWGYHGGEYEVWKSIQRHVVRTQRLRSIGEFKDRTSRMKSKKHNQEIENRYPGNLIALPEKGKR